MVAADTLQSSMALLQTVPEGCQSSMYEHLTTMVLKLLEDKPESISLKHISDLIKRQAMDKVESDPLVPFTQEADSSSSRAALKLYGDCEPPIHPVTGKPVKTRSPNAYAAEDTAKAGSLFGALGVAVSEPEMYSVSLQVKLLGEDPKLKLKSVRLFGKFMGMFADYYVFEAAAQVPAPLAAETPEERLAREGEREYPPELGTGANTYQYYVCNEIGQKATRLPDVRPEHVRAARTLKRFLTGSLNSAVSMYPPFPWTEATFLRAQIARIAATTVLTPTDWFASEEDDDGIQSIKRAEEITPVALPEAGALQEWVSNWVHRYHHIKRQGRCETKPICELPEDTEEEVELTEDETEEPPEGGNVLAPVTEDTKVLGGPAWTPVLSSSSRFAKGQVMGMRSNLWPGAVVATHGQDVFNVYIGWGLKNCPYVPPPPPPITEEFDQALMASLDMPQKTDPDAAPPVEAVEEEESTV